MKNEENTKNKAEELNDEELDNVAGGVIDWADSAESTVAGMPKKVEPKPVGSSGKIGTPTVITPIKRR